jgi:excisionase family DNA binding protein
MGLLFGVALFFFVKENYLKLETTMAASDLFEPLLTTEEAAEHLRVHVKTIQKLARECKVPCVRMGKYWRFRLSALDHWVISQQNQFSQPLRVE